MPMNVILLERVPKLGQMGDVVKVKPGYARNFLLPQKKALRATKDNITYFESQRKTLEAQNLERRQEAEAVGAKMSDLKVTLIRQASEALQLYGSVSSRDIADAAAAAGVKIERGQVELDKPIKSLGAHKIKIHLHPEVTVEITALVGRSPDEAEFLAKGGTLVAETERAQLEAAEAARRAAEQAAARVRRLFQTHVIARRWHAFSFVLQHSLCDFDPAGHKIVIARETFALKLPLVLTFRPSTTRSHAKCLGSSYSALPWGNDDAARPGPCSGIGRRPTDHHR